MTDALYLRQQAERFARVADQCSIAMLAPYYRQMAAEYSACADRVAAGLDPPHGNVIDWHNWERMLR